MVKGYDIWVCHGEDFIVRDAPPPVPTCSPIEDPFDTHDLLRDAFGFHDMSNPMNENIEEDESNEDNIGSHVQNDDDLNEKVIEFYKYVEEFNKELYPGSKAIILSFTVQLMHIKSYYKWSGTSVGMLLKFLKQQFLESNIPTSLYEAKKITNTLGLGYEKIDVCPNNCILYKRDKAEQQSCHICNASRWQLGDDISVKGCKKKKTACKVMRYFPLIPRLQRLYVSSKTSSSMLWHNESRTNDGILRHPVDSHAWKAFDQRYPDFASDPRNVRLGLASDGFNSFGLMSSAYSIWHVILIAYNLPPWICMRQSSLILSMIIPGKEVPRDKIDIFLLSLIDELLQLWEGVQTYDATSKKNFTIRASLMWTINDFPAYASLSGWSTKGEKTCPCCANMTESKCLSNGRKFCYLGHRRWLHESHEFREQSDDFDGTVEWRTAPKTLSGSDALRQLEGVNFISETISNSINEAIGNRFGFRFYVQ